VAVTNSIQLTQASASLTNAVVSSPDLGGAAGSLFRLTGSLALVFAVLIGVVWMYRQWQRLMLQRAPVTGLRILDAKNLGQRTSLYVVAYRHQQFLIGGSSNGLSLISTLDLEPSEGEGGDPGTEAGTPEPPSPGNAFRKALDQALSPSK
jgi:flagellar biogenesis protein FliO